jgi:3D (Asp-Asp-Asp) domain-containing protein
VIDDGTEIELVQITREETRALVRLPFKTRQLLDPNLPAGSRRVDQDGQEGVRVLILEAVFEDGRRVSERLVGTQDLLEPIERVIRVGIKPVPLPADGTHSFVQLIEGSATSYCLTGTTATGTQAGPGSIAVDPSVIKLGSHVYVTGYGFGYAVDTGSAIIGTLVDVWYDCDQAVQWGRRAVTIYVLSS